MEILPGQDIPIKEGTHIFDCQRKKRSAIVRGKDALHRKIFDVISSVFSWYYKRHKELEKNIFYIKN